MASATFPEEFSCSVCLEILHDPATLPCGHTYCLPCIQGHWDRGEAKQEYSCPQCRKAFKPRPMLARSTLLVEAMEKLRVRGEVEGNLPSISSAPPSLPSPPHTGPQGGGLYPQLSASPQLCHKHQRPLEVFCQEDQECVCPVCRDHAHRGHRVVSVEAERAERQREVAEMQRDTHRRIQESERDLQLLPQNARAHKELLLAVQREARELFTELKCSLELTGSRVLELLGAQEMAEGCRAEGHIHRLEQHLAQLRRRDGELRRLLHIQDSYCFLKNFLTLDFTHLDGEEKLAGVSSEAALRGVQAALGELRDTHQEICKASLALIFRTVNDTSALAPAPRAGLPPSSVPSEHTAVLSPQTPVNEVEDHRKANQNPTSGTASQTQGFQHPQPKTREELLKFRFEPTLDPDTAFRQVWLSEGGHKATLRAETQPYPEHPDRFLYWRQVLCREPLAGSPYYWEVEWSGQKVTIGVAYAAMGRKGSDDSCRLGHNDQSWSLYWSGTGFSLWHCGQEMAVSGPKARRVGVYLDQQAGVLAFYRVSQDQVHLLHRIQTEFSGPLYPGFRFWSGVGCSITICQLG
ncbi:hypothetical protein JZ751_013468 [Albula glossodonta]|uniref:Tripartite motif-containing protein 16-like n=1 Tax=Albula glossodonta TaxID=121402 RepID=A0A8T2MYY6_9TELE|nr:hypothetical protein JZ751_013468 [Albula glossodonta]